MSGLFNVEILPVFTTNNIYLLHDVSSNKTAVVDPGEDTAVLQAIEQQNRRLTAIFLTHHHADHTGGVTALKKRTGAVVYGFRGDKNRIPDIDIELDDGSVVEFAGAPARVYHVPGHTLGSIVFHFFNEAILFTGDTLFQMGCGRLFEGSMQQMHQSLTRLAALPEDTRIYSGHEYAHGNARFALTIDPNNVELLARFKHAAEIEDGLFTNPSTIAQERITNPFLRASAPEIAQHLGMPHRSELDIFTEIRERKDAFNG